MDNYLCINGKKTELTKEQLKQLGIEVPKESFFNRVKRGENYYCINSFDNVVMAFEMGDRYDDRYFLNGNYCTNKSIMEQRVLHETLNRLLWRYSMEHDGDKIDCGNTDGALYFLAYNRFTKEWFVNWNVTTFGFGAPCFCSKEIAKRAIEEIVKPFLAEHPEFKF